MKVLRGCNGLWLHQDHYFSLMCFRMSRVCETWSLEELTGMNDEDMEALLGFYKPGTVPKFREIHDVNMADEFVFDGSFGWW